MAENLPEYKFEETSRQLLISIGTMIRDLKQVKGTQHDPNQIENFAEILGSYNNPKNKLVLLFIEHHTLWINIKNREISFLLEDVPTLFKNIPLINTDSLIAPVVAFERHKTKGGKCPITQEDIDGLWKYFDYLIIFACRYHKAHRTNYNIEEWLIYENKYTKKK